MVRYTHTGRRLTGRRATRHYMRAVNGASAEGRPHDRLTGTSAPRVRWHARLVPGARPARWQRIAITYARRVR